MSFIDNTKPAISSDTETRNALDPQGNIIGTVTLPSGTTEDQWTKALHNYANPPVTTLVQVLRKVYRDAVHFGAELQDAFIVENIGMGITAAGKTKAVADYLRQVERYVSQGSLYAAIEQINALIAAGIPGDLAPYVTEERLTTFRDDIKKYLGVANE